MLCICIRVEVIDLVSEAQGKIYEDLNKVQSEDKKEGDDEQGAGGDKPVSPVEPPSETPVEPAAETLEQTGMTSYLFYAFYCGLFANNSEYCFDCTKEL